MGGVCSAGSGKKLKHMRNAELVKKSNESSLSRRLKSARSFRNLKRNSIREDEDDFGKSEHQLQKEKLDSSDQRSSVSSELNLAVIPSKAKAVQRNSFIGRAGIAGLEKAVEVLDTLGSSMSNFNSGSGFVSGMVPRGNRISILSFEVANTIAKGAKLLHSVSEENIQFLKKEILHSEGVQLLVSSDMNKLLRIAAADKRDELDVFSREVIRFGNLCKDLQWHNLDRFFSKLDSDYSVQTQLREEADKAMQDLTTLADHTSELYHELHALDRFEQDCKQKHNEMESLHLSRKGDSLTSLQSELKLQRKIVRSLKKKSLWSRNLEEIVEKLVDIVTYIHQAILEAFGVGDYGQTLVDEDPSKTTRGLGVAGLALHYANLINQIDNIASRPTFLPPNMREKLYHGLPVGVKSALRSRLLTLDADEKLQISQVKAEMEKTLRWLVPLATNTAKAHQGFGWVGEWATSGNEFGNKTATQSNLVRLQTLYHADMQKTDIYILDLVIWLHQLTNLVRHRDHGFKHLPVRSPSNKMQRIPSLKYTSKSERIKFSQEDMNLLDEVNMRRWVPGISKSQEISKTKKRGGRSKKSLCRSIGSSPSREWGAATGIFEMEATKIRVLDVLDGLESPCIVE